MRQSKSNMCSKKLIKRSSLEVIWRISSFTIGDQKSASQFTTEFAHELRIFQERFKLFKSKFAQSHKRRWESREDNASRSDKHGQKRGMVARKALVALATLAGVCAAFAPAPRGLRVATWSRGASTPASRSRLRVLALQLNNSSLALEVERDDEFRSIVMEEDEHRMGGGRSVMEEDDELRSIVLDKAGQAAIDTVDPWSRLAVEMLGRVDHSMLAVARKVGVVLEKSLPSLHGAVAKAQIPDLSLLSGSKHMSAEMFRSGLSMLSHDQIFQMLWEYVLSVAR